MEQNIQELWYNYQRYNLLLMGIPAEKKGRNRRNIWNNNDWEFPQINVRHQTTDPDSAGNTKKDKHQKTNKQKTPTTIPRHIIFKCRKSNIKKKSWKKPEEKNLSLTEKQR